MAVLAGLTACASAPPTTFHSLSAPPSPAVSEQTDARVNPTGATTFYDFGSVSIPARVDVPQFVVRNADGSLTQLEQQRWAAPLADEIRGAIVEQLSREYDARLSSQAPPGQQARERLQVDVLGFESVPAREVRLEAAWTVRTLDDKPTGVSCKSSIRQGVGDGFEALTEGHRAALRQLSGYIGRAMRDLQQGRATCP